MYSCTWASMEINKTDVILGHRKKTMVRYRWDIKIGDRMHRNAFPTAKKNLKKHVERNIEYNEVENYNK